MSKSIDNTQFMDWVDQFVNDTISPADAEQLLNCVRQDPERLDLLCSQLQTDRLLEILNKQNQVSSIAEVVLKRTEGMTSSKDLKSIKRSKVFLKVAASLVILLGIGSLVMPRLSGKSDQAQGARHRGLTSLDEAESMQVGQQSAPIPGKEMKGREGLDDKFADSDSGLYARNTHDAPKPDAAPVPKKKLASTAKPEQKVAIQAKFIEFNEGVSKELGFEWSTSADIRDDKIATSAKLAERNTENYAQIEENEFKNTADTSLSTFSIDVDTASYSNVRRFLTQGSLPPVDAVRIEEMINYFEYDYKGPAGNDPFSTSMALTDCPWNKDHQLLRIGLQGKKISQDEQKNSNIVFLMDVSGSMNSSDKLPLLKRGFEKMVRALGEKDRIAIVVYAGSSGVVLDSTSALDKDTIINAMNRLRAGGSTAGGQGIELAYRLATDHFIKDGINRVILATDGDFNVGVSNMDALQKLIEEKRNTGVFLSVLGFGTGNLQDAKMELLANKGNGNYFYIDSEREAEKVLVKQLIANMVTIAKDVKIQVEFNPALVRSYRLIGYENRIMAARDFDDDTKDAGEIGAGHQVTALYELVPVDAPASEDGVALKYSKPAETTVAPVNSSELLTLKLRYKQPEGSTSKLLTFALNKEAYEPDSMDESFRWATSVAAFGMHLRNSSQVSTFTMQEMLDLAESATESDPNGYRKECIGLMKKAMSLKSGETSTNNYPEWQFRN